MKKILIDDKIFNKEKATKITTSKKYGNTKWETLFLSEKGTYIIESNSNYAFVEPYYRKISERDAMRFILINSDDDELIESASTFFEEL